MFLEENRSLPMSQSVQEGVITYLFSDSCKAVIITVLGAERYDVKNTAGRPVASPDLSPAGEERRLLYCLYRQYHLLFDYLDQEPYQEPTIEPTKCSYYCTPSR